MRKLFSEMDPNKTSEDIIEAGIANNWPYLIMIHAFNKENSAAPIILDIIKNELEELALSLNTTKNLPSAKDRITTACEKIINEAQKKFDFGRNFDAKNPVNFSLVLMLPFLGGKKIISFGLGSCMIAFERSKKFYTVKPAILSSGKSRHIPYLEGDDKIILAAKNELIQYTQILELMPDDLIHIISPECCQFLQCEIIQTQNEKIILLCETQEMPSLRALQRFSREKDQARKKLSLETELEVQAPLIRDLQQKIQDVEEELFEFRKRCEPNPAWQTQNLRQELVKLLESQKQAQKNLETIRLSKKISRLVYNHNQIELKVLNTHREILPTLRQREKGMLDRLDILKKQLHMATPTSRFRQNRDLDFSHAFMRIPKGDYDIFELRMDLFIRSITPTFNKNQKEYLSRVPDCSQFDTSAIRYRLNNYFCLFNQVFKDSVLGRFLLVLIILEIDNDFGYLLLQACDKENLSDFICGLPDFDIRKQEALQSSLLSLKKACQMENLNENEIWEKLVELEALLNDKCTVKSEATLGL